MKRLLLILLLLLPALAYAQTAPTPDTTHFRTLGFHGNVNLNYNYASPGNAGYNGVGADVILGSRFTQWYLLGGGVGFHSLLNLGHEDYNLFATIYLQNSFYIPVKAEIYPMFDLAIGCDFGWFGVNQDYFTPTVGLYARAGAGFEIRYVSLSLGYEYIGVSTFYMKVGYNF